MQIYLIVVVCVANLLFRHGNLCSAIEVYLSANSSSDGVLSSWDATWGITYTWIITAPYGQKVLLNFDRVRVSNSYYCQSYLQVRDGPYSFSPLLTKRCETSTPPSPVYSSGTQLYVQLYKSYGGYYDNGFSAVFRALTSNSAGECPVALEGNNTGVIYSPGFPFQYPDNTRCTWTIKAPYYTSYNYLLLNFTVFDVENGCYDKVVVRDGLYSWSSELGEYCDTSTPPFVVTPSGRYAGVEFTSDMGISGKGFLMFYKFLDYPYRTTPAWWTEVTVAPRWWTPTPHLDYTRRVLAIVLPIVVGIILMFIIIVIVLCQNNKRASAPPAVTAPPVAELPLQTLPQHVSLPSTAFPVQQRVQYVPTVATPVGTPPTAPVPSPLLSVDEPQVEFSGGPGAEIPPTNDADWVANFSDQTSSQSHDTSSERPFEVAGENYYAPSPVQS